MVLKDLFIRKVHTINNAHGPSRGVMCIRSTNEAGDRIMFTSGYQDDGRVRVWDFMERSILAEVEAKYEDYRDSIYSMNLFKFEPDYESEVDPEQGASKSKLSWL